MEHPITTCGAVTLGYRNITITTHEQQVDMMTTGDDITDASACDVAAEPMTYHIILVMGCTFVSIYSFVALNSTRFGMKWLLCKQIDMAIKHLQIMYLKLILYMIWI